MQRLELATDSGNFRRLCCGVAQRNKTLLGGGGIDKGFKIDTARLFFALDHKLDPARVRAAHGFDRVERRKAALDMTLVVGDPARKKLPVAEGRLKRRRLPQV